VAYVLFWEEPHVESCGEAEFGAAASWAKFGSGRVVFYVAYYFAEVVEYSHLVIFGSCDVCCGGSVSYWTSMLSFG